MFVDDLWLIIFSFCSLRDLVTFKSVDKRLRKLVIREHQTNTTINLRFEDQRLIVYFETLDNTFGVDFDALLDIDIPVNFSTEHNQLINGKTLSYPTFQTHCKYCNLEVIISSEKLIIRQYSDYIENSLFYSLRIQKNKLTVYKLLMLLQRYGREYNSITLNTMKELWDCKANVQ